MPKDRQEQRQSQLLSDNSRFVIDQPRSSSKQPYEGTIKRTNTKRKEQATKRLDPLIKMLSQGQKLSSIHKPPRECGHIRIVSDASENINQQCTVCKAHEIDFRKHEHPFSDLVKINN